MARVTTVEAWVLGALGCVGLAAAPAEPAAVGGAVPVARWSFEGAGKDLGQDTAGGHQAALRGAPRPAPGVEGQAVRLDGEQDLLTVPSAPALCVSDGDFSVSAWVNPYELGRGQQMIAAKNVYSADQREWGLMLDKDDLFRFYVWQGGWKTLGGRTRPEPGRWHHVAVTVEKGQGRIYVNGKEEGAGPLAPAVAPTGAPLSLGGVQDGGGVRQTFYGALDEVALYRGALSPEAIRAQAERQTTPHAIPVVERAPIWDGGDVPETAAIPVLQGVEFRIIKPYEFGKDGYRFLHGVALAWHKGRLYASFGHNKGGENTDTEEARGRASDDGGRTWGGLFTIDAGEPGLGVSHGVFLSHGGRLWAFHGAYRGTMQNVHTRAYVLDERSHKWERKGAVIEGGFWPLQEPLKMEDGNWMMAGISVREGNPAAVAISRGDNLMQWDLVVIPRAPGVTMWGESTVFVNGRRVANIARHQADRPAALVAFSEDYGRTWSASRRANLPMASSKPYAGTLSTGQHYLVNTTTADSGGRRSPLTIAVSRPGERVFSRVFVIRHALFPGGPGESHERAALAYPYAVEHEGKLYVGYSNSGGGVGRQGEGRELWNNNSAEMAIIPISALAVSDR